jgi:secreted trypsin-like serine protease
VGLLATACVVSCSSRAPSLIERVAMTSSAIQGGSTDSTHLFAVGVVQLAQADQNMVAFCSGVLLAPNLVATARHCVAELTSTTIDCTSSTFGALYPADKVFVTTDTTITMASIDRAPTTAKVIVPTGSNQTSVCGNDIALLILGQSITLPEYATPVITPPMTDAQYEPIVAAIGYGIDTPTDTQGNSAGIRRIKQDVELTCIPDDTNFTDCFTDPEAKSVLTAGEFVSGDSTCEGDSGSAAFEQANFTNGQWVAFGVLSRGGVSTDGTTCDQPIYTRFDAWGSLIVGAAQQAQQMATANGTPYVLPAWAGGTRLADGGTTLAAVTDGAAADEAGLNGSSVQGRGSGGCSLAPSDAPRSGRGLAALGLGLAWATAARRRRSSHSARRT